MGRGLWCASPTVLCTGSRLCGTLSWPRSGGLRYGYIALEGGIMATGRKRRMSLSTQVLVGLVLGLLAGVVFGERMAPLHGVGRAFILLLQMPVLPYITLSLITGLGQLNYQQVKMLAIKAGSLLVLSS